MSVGWAGSVERNGFGYDGIWDIVWDGINELARWKKLFVEAAMMGYLAGK